jgi:hypothetical protein
MAGTVVDRNLLKIKWTHPIKARQIDTVLVRIRTALVMRIYSAARAEVMPCGLRVELVETRAETCAAKRG